MSTKKCLISSWDCVTKATNSCWYLKPSLMPKNQEFWNVFRVKSLGNILIYHLGRCLARKRVVLGIFKSNSWLEGQTRASLTRCARVWFFQVQIVLFSSLIEPIESPKRYTNDPHRVWAKTHWFLAKTLTTSWGQLVHKSWAPIRAILTPLTGQRELGLKVDFSSVVWCPLFVFNRLKAPSKT